MSLAHNECIGNTDSEYKPTAVPEFPQRTIFCRGLERGLWWRWKQPILLFDIHHLGGSSLLVSLTLLLLMNMGPTTHQHSITKHAPKSKLKARALTAAAAAARGRLLQCLKMPAFSRSVSAHRNKQSHKASRSNETLAHGGDATPVHTIEAELDGGLHPLVVEERLQLLAGRRGLLPCLHKPEQFINSNKAPTPTRTEQRIGVESSDSIHEFLRRRSREATYRRHRARQPGDSSGFGRFGGGTVRYWQD